MNLDYEALFPFPHFMAILEQKLPASTGEK
jgi:hypothetical protein